MRNLFLFLIALYAMTVGAEQQATATLSLDEILRLHDLSQQPAKPKVDPPQSYSVTRFDAQGRIVGDALEATVTIELSVFQDGWVRVPLLQQTTGLSFTQLPTPEHAHLASADGVLSLVTEKAGSYRFELTLRQQAQKQDGQWRVQLSPAEALIQRLRFKHNADLFEVGGADLRRDGDSLVLLGNQGQLVLHWRALREPTAQPRQQAQRPPIEPLVNTAVASVVVTLDGQRITRGHYKLRLQGAQTLAVAIPRGQVLSKVYLNGVPQTVQPVQDGQAVQLSVSPARPGEESAVLELVLKSQMPPMALAGTLSFTLPRLSWGINNLHCAFHLPKVFNYQWQGGSMSPDNLAPPVDYTYRIPTPGKLNIVRQQLVSGAADAQIAFTVDLDGRYFQ